jgi:type I restriction enzyme S subunit
LINVKYLCYILNQITYKYKTSESNNGKLDIVHMLDIPVLLPVDKNGRIDLVKQNEIVELYDKLTLIKNGLMSESNKINHLIG